ncbi:MAG TPA: hypothetical protein VEI52_22130 [Terriglobales bacterium]|nr:hypothetical protein [Terriglobales bacterium]
MAGNRLDLVRGYLTPSVVSKMAAIVAESPALTQKAVDVQARNNPAKYRRPRARLRILRPTYKFRQTCPIIGVCRQANHAGVAEWQTQRT